MGVWFPFGDFVFILLFFLLRDSFSFCLISQGRSPFQLTPTMYMLFVYGGTEVFLNSSVHPSLKFLIPQKIF